MMMSREELPESSIKTSVNRQKVYDNQDDEKETEILDQYRPYYDSFKQFIDHLIDDEADDVNKTPPSNNKASKRKNTIKSNNKRREEYEYQNDSYDHNSQQNLQKTDENQSKFMNEAQEQKVFPFNKDGLATNDAYNLQNSQNQDITGSVPDQNNAQNGSTQNSQNLIMQMLASHVSGQQPAQPGFSQANPNFMQGQMGMFNQSNLAMNSQSLLLLQRIIQTTPEIQLLHQQEQLALYQIQQSIKAALSQNLGQEVISHLVMEYNKTQKQHQVSIQAAIQKTLTLLLCHNNPQPLFNQQTQMAAQPEAQPEQIIEPNIEKYRRSSYHLGIAYYIYDQKKKEYTQQQQQQQMMAQSTAQMQAQSHNQMLLSSMMQGANMSQVMQPSNLDGAADINSKVDDLMKS
jgi:hypothetical protein